jgi:hypothetical protein
MCSYGNQFGFLESGGGGFIIDQVSSLSLLIRLIRRIDRGKVISCGAHYF